MVSEGKMGFFFVSIFMETFFIFYFKYTHMKFTKTIHTVKIACHEFMLFDICYGILRLRDCEFEAKKNNSKVKE